MLQIPFQEVFRPKNLPKIHKIHSQKGLGALGYMYFRPFLYGQFLFIIGFYKAPPHLGSSMRSRPKRRRRRKARGCLVGMVWDGGGCGMRMLSHKNLLVVATQTSYQVQTSKLVSSFNQFLFLNLKFEEMIQFDGCICFQLGWFNHQLGIIGSQVTGGLEIQETYPNPLFLAGSSPHTLGRYSKLHQGYVGEIPREYMNREYYYKVGPY